MAKTTALQLSDNARVVLERRYLAKDDDGNVIETPEQLFRRVAHNVAQAERLYGAQPDETMPRPSGRGIGPSMPRGLARGTAESMPRPSGRGTAAIEAAFYELMTSLRFLPNSPTLGNAGRPLQQLSACFVLPVEDSMVSIFDAVKQTALIHQSGGGTGFAFSRLRPAGDVVRTTGGIASGPVSFMRVFDAATEAIKQGGTRRGANMAILDVHHPDIETFINVKGDMTTLTNFNISVAVDEAFMRAVEADEEYDLVNPRTGEVVGRRRARAVFDQIVANAWRNGDPGLVFLDRINADNPTPQLGAMEATNPCGEQPLLPYESCNLGSLNLSKFVRNKEQGTGNKELPMPRGSARGTEEPMPRGSARGTEEPMPQGSTRGTGRVESMPGPSGRGIEEAGVEVDWDALAAVIPLAVRFLDDVIDMNAYPVPQIDEQTRLTRKIGLGVMGFADLLFQLAIPYDSEDALALADRLMAFISEHADAASEALAAERGTFPAWEDSIYGPNFAGRRSQMPRGSARGTEEPMPRGSARGTEEPMPRPSGLGTPRPLRNSTRTTVAPTGTLSIIADCTGGIEPAFALAFTRSHYLDPRKPSQPVRLTEVNKVFEAAARARGVYSDELVDYLAAGGSLHDRPEVPDDLKHVFVTAHEIAPGWHVRMQAAFQRHTDNAVSKTINFPRQATIADVAGAYLLAYHEGCKGITIYRDGSRAGQVLSHIAEGEGIPISDSTTSFDASHEINGSSRHPEPVEGRAPALRPLTAHPEALVGPTSSDQLSLTTPDANDRPRRRGATGGSRARNRYTPPRPALPFSEIHTTDGCPDCGAHLVFSEGCLLCRSCGFTRCG